MTITVANLRGRPRRLPPDGPTHFRVDRLSCLGNPYKGERNQTIEQYKPWIAARLREFDSLQAQAMDTIYAALCKHNHVTLWCWCNPKPCHADVLATYLKQRLNGNGSHAE